MRAVRRLKPPSTFYYEDTQGNNVPFELTDCAHPSVRWHSQHSKQVIVQHQELTGGRYDAHWIVRLLKWLLNRCPGSWFNTRVLTRSSTSIHCGWRVIKYLVEQGGLNFDDACILYSECCSRCLDWLEYESHGKNPLKEDPRFNLRHDTHCSHCKEVDPAYNYRYITWRLYRAFNRGQNLPEVWAGLKDFV